jgi:hypothetical protein
VVKTGIYLVMIMLNLYQATRFYVSEHVIIHSHRLEKANIQGKEKERSRIVTQFYNYIQFPRLSILGINPVLQPIT